MVRVKLFRSECDTFALVSHTSHNKCGILVMYVMCAMCDPCDCLLIIIIIMKVPVADLV